MVGNETLDNSLTTKRIRINKHTEKKQYPETSRVFLVGLDWNLFKTESLRGRINNLLPGFTLLYLSACLAGFLSSKRLPFYSRY